MSKTPALVLASILMLSGPAFAERAAPITQGVTNADLAQQVTQARQQGADLKVQLNSVSADMMTLTGRIETLEFELQQARRQNESLTTDNETLSRQMNALQGKFDRQEKAIRAIEARLSRGLADEEPVDGEAEVSAYPGAASTETGDYASGGSYSGSGPLRTVTAGSTTGPRRIVTTSSGGTTESVARSAERAVSDQAPIQAAAPDSASLPPGTLGTISASALPGEAGPLFAAAKSKLIQFDYAGAEQAFRTFLDQFGDDPQAGEAHYWLAESLYQQKAYADSGAAYTTMIRSYPDDARAPDALVKLARAMRLIGDTEKACLALDTLPKRYPKASGVTRDLAAVERTKSGCDN